MEGKEEEEGKKRGKIFDINICLLGVVIAILSSSWRRCLLGELGIVGVRALRRHLRQRHRIR